MKSVPAINRFIHKRCLELDLTPTEFGKRIDRYIEDDGSKVKGKDSSTYRKYYNGKITPGEDVLPYVAKALGVTFDELMACKRSRFLAVEEQLEGLQYLLEISENEAKLVYKLCNFDKSYSRFFCFLFFSLGLFFLNATIWKSGIIYLACILILIYALVKDRIKYKKECKDQKALKKEINDITLFWNYLKKDNIVSSTLKVYLIGWIPVSFLPFIESIFYRGTFYITSLVYLSLALLFFVKYIRTKD